MKICRGLPEPETFNDPVVTVGTFDGIHMGHLALMEAARAWAAETGGQSVAVTFEEHPGAALSEGRPLALTSFDRRLELIEAAGIDGCVVLQFDEKLAAMGPHEFIEDILHAGIGSTCIVAGHDWRFGKSREGGESLLTKLQKEGSIKVRFVEAMKEGGEIVSSSVIREAVSGGDIEKARRMLGRPFSLCGRVIPGTGRGRELGFPTANLDVQGIVLPPDGVYSATVDAGEKRYPGVVSVGNRPTFRENSFAVEVHLAGFSGDLYGTMVTAELNFLLRPQEAFKDTDALIAQMKKDLRAAAPVDAGDEQGAT